MSAFVTQQKTLGFAVELTCRTLGTAASAFYKRASGGLSTRAQEDARLLELIRRCYRENYECYGSLRLWRQLRKDGVEVGRGRVERLMAANAIVGAKRRGRGWTTTIAGRTRRGARTWSTAISPRRARTRSTWRTSPT